MTQSIEELEREIEESRARLDTTIDQIQDRLTVSGIVDDVMGTVQRSSYGTTMDRALAAVRDNPVPVLLVVAGLGWLITRMTRDMSAEAAGDMERRAAVRDPMGRPVGTVHPVAPDLGTPHTSKVATPPLDATPTAYVPPRPAGASI